MELRTGAVWTEAMPNFALTTFQKKFILPEGEGSTMGSTVRSVLVIVISWCRMQQAREISEIASKV
jgi:hypothetical protein